MNLLTFRNRLEDKLVDVYSRLIGRSFRRYGRGWIHPTARIDNPEYISIDKAYVGRWCWIYAMTCDSAEHSYEPEIVIGRGTAIYDFCHITCATKLTIGESVLINYGVLITDSAHVYSDPATPIMKQGLASRPISIGDGSWLGEHAAIVGCSVGRHCVVGANAVVTHDVPDYCVVAGAPARIIKRLDTETGLWTHSDSTDSEHRVWDRTQRGRRAA
jgi:acetyltransferase-like isoleucine patch superfamily enzyme